MRMRYGGKNPQKMSKENRGNFRGENWKLNIYEICHSKQLKANKLSTKS